MEPRHQDFAAEEVSIDRETNEGDDAPDRTGADTVDDLAPEGDDTGYDAEIEDESQI